MCKARAGRSRTNGLIGVFGSVAFGFTAHTPGAHPSASTSPPTSAPPRSGAAAPESNGRDTRQRWWTRSCSVFTRREKTHTHKRFPLELLWILHAMSRQNSHRAKSKWRLKVWSPKVGDQIDLLETLWCELEVRGEENNTSPGGDAVSLVHICVTCAEQESKMSLLNLPLQRRFDVSFGSRFQ